MTQWPNEKDPHSNWQSPPDSKSPPPSGKAQSDWLSPPEQGQGSDLTLDDFSSRNQQGQCPPPQDPPPDYEYAKKHPGYAPIPVKDHDIYCVPPPRPASAPPSDAGPSFSSGSQNPNQTNAKSGGFLMSLGAFFGNKGPPPMWQRPAPSHFSYNAFPPMCLISNNHNLGDGFPELPPPCQMNPHPFATHDVTEEDWKRFLADVKKAGGLSPGQLIKSNLIPTAMGLNLITGFLATTAIEKKMKYQNRGAAGDVLDHWNHYFFGPRRMEVVLCQASERLSGRLGAAPVGDPNLERMANGLRRHGRGDDDYSSDSSSDSDDSDDRRHGLGLGLGGRGFERGGGFGRGFGFDTQARRTALGDRRELKRERRHQRRERRGLRREEKRAVKRERKDKRNDKTPYQLFITAI